MTSDLGVERGIDHPFRFHCSCGAIIETTAKKEICRDCGETIEVVRCVPRPHGDKYTLRISKHRRGWNEQSTIWPPVIAGTPRPMRNQQELVQPTFRSAAANSQTRHREAPNHERRFFHLGMLILLLTAVFAFAYWVPPEKYREWSALASAPPKPEDCDWTTLPMGNKHCHYDPIFHHVNEQDQSITVSWRRAND